MEAPGFHNGGNDFAGSSPGYCFAFFGGKQACDHITKNVTGQHLRLLRPVEFGVGTVVAGWFAGGADLWACRHAGWACGAGRLSAAGAAVRGGCVLSAHRTPRSMGGRR
jgi:hypothetical protein